MDQSFGSITPRLNWNKASHKRCYAHVGKLSIEVVRVGIDPNKFWVIGEMFGNPHSSNNTRYNNVGEAQVAAESMAHDLLESARQFLVKAGISHKVMR